MNQRHKDIIKRLREYDYYGLHSIECRHSYGTGEMDIIISLEDNDHEIMLFDLRDLLAIVRNVDIGEQEDQTATLRSVLSAMVELIDSSGGPTKLSEAVDLGEISWMVTMQGWVDRAKSLLGEDKEG